jgi:DNA-binding CsgD family transcriptional regulator
MARTAVIGSAVGSVTAVLVAGGFALGVHAGNLHNGLIAAAFTVVGLFVVGRRPGNREGWLFVATGAGHAVLFAGRQYGMHDGPLPGASWIGWFGVWPLPLVLVVIGVTVMYFPTGRLPSRGWRPAVVVMAAAGVLLASVSALWPVEYARTGLVAAHPLNLPGAARAEAFYQVARPVGYLLCQLTWAGSVVVRLRRARGDERDPLRELTDRERAVLARMAQGLSNSAVAAELHLAVKTVEAHVTSIFAKLGLHQDDREHRRVLAVLTFLRGGPA